MGLLLLERNVPFKSFKRMARVPLDSGEGKHLSKKSRTLTETNLDGEAAQTGEEKNMCFFRLWDEPPF